MSILHKKHDDEKPDETHKPEPKPEPKPAPQPGPALPPVTSLSSAQTALAELVRAMRARAGNGQDDPKGIWAPALQGFATDLARVLGQD